MTQNARVIKIENDKTYVLVKRTSACSGNCISCSGCDEKKITIQVENSIGAKLGDDVVIFSNTKRTLYLAFKLYILPIVMFFAILFLNEAYKFSPAILTGLIVATVVLWIFILKKSRAPVSTIVEVVSQ